MVTSRTCLMSVLLTLVMLGAASLAQTAIAPIVAVHDEPARTIVASIHQ